VLIRQLFKVKNPRIFYATESIKIHVRPEDKGKFIVDLERRTIGVTTNFNEGAEFKGTVRIYENKEEKNDI